MVFASTGRNARYCLLGAKLPSQPLTEVTLHANHPSHIWEVIWMPLALVAPKSAGDWVKPKVNSTNWRESGGILPCTPTKNPYLPSSCRLNVVVLNKAELRKIDGFQAKCLRSILHIPPPYISRVSNATVLQRSHCKRLSAILKFRQLCLFQSIAVLMMFADDAFSNLVSLFCKTCQLHAAGVAPNKYGLPKCIEWQWKLLKVLTC